MSRKSGIVLTALVGGATLWLWQRFQGRSHGLPHEITRWEDEGGSLPTATGNESGAPRRGPAPALAANGGAPVGSTPDAWEFPRS